MVKEVGINPVIRVQCRNQKKWVRGTYSKTTGS